MVKKVKKWSKIVKMILLNKTSRCHKLVLSHSVPLQIPKAFCQKTQDDANCRVSLQKYVTFANCSFTISSLNTCM